MTEREIYSMNKVHFNAKEQSLYRINVLFNSFLAEGIKFYKAFFISWVKHPLFILCTCPGCTLFKKTHNVNHIDSSQILNESM